MKLSNRQKRALEKITGKLWDTWHPTAVKAYFNYTDRGDDRLISALLGDSWASWCRPIWEGTADKIQKDLFELIVSHKFHAYTVETWKVDFQKGLLSLDDFLSQGCPQSYIDHAFEVYREAMGSIPHDIKA